MPNVATPEQRAEQKAYKRARDRAMLLFAKIGHGGRSKAAEELKIRPTTVSFVLNGRWKQGSADTLRRLIEWAENELKSK